ncbi:MAG TPA: glycosyltransferase family 39 protein, partial [Usitatibacteraceae bacterium]|nr:glycosyltransferase family 39 protein [Usitatibacteraceae bacterium]
MVPIPPSWRSRLAFAAGWTVIAAAAAWLVINLAGWSSTTPFDFDAKKYYIPYAQRFLAEGWAFFADPKSVHVPPFSFLFAALTGAELGLQKAIGIGLSLATLLMVARMAMVVHSPAAGVCAAALFALTPLLPPYLSSGSVEPLYVFLFTAWLALLVEGAQRNATGWFVAAGIALGLAALTRATLVYFIPVVIVAALVLRWRRLGMRTLAKGLLTAHILALALVAPVIVRNLLLHGLPAISTGAGIALYAGHHANTWGFDPGYFNVAFDFGILGKDGWWHLDVEMDRLLAVMAKKVVASYEWMFLLKLYAIKAASFLFVSNQEWIAPVATLRGWRITELGLAALGAAAVLHRPIALLILAVTAFQFVAHVPVLYALRYSVVALEIPLILFAAIGLARASAWPWQRQLAGAGMLAAAILGGTLLAR